MSLELRIKALAEHIASILKNNNGGVALCVGPTNNLSSKGIWIQTGLGERGDDFSLWFEDGL